MNRVVMLACAAGLSSLAALAPGAAYAADTGARGEANAVHLTILDSEHSSGAVTASNDGAGELKTGETTPPLSVLGGQSLISAGVLAQDSDARDDGTSAACAGVAGDGASLVEIGETGCLTPGDNVRLTLAELDLSEVTAFNQGSALASLDTATQPILDALTPVLSTLQSDLAAITADADDLLLTVDADALQAECTYDGQVAAGSTTLVNAGVRVVAPGGDSVFAPTEPIISLTHRPGRNEDLSGGLQGVLDDVLAEAETVINQTLDDEGVLFTGLIAPVRAALVTQILGQIDENLKPLEGDLLEVWLNRQPDDGSDGTVEVTGLYVSLLPAATAFGAPTLLQLDIANVACGPMELAPVDDDSGSDSGTSDPATPSATDTDGNPVPTAVNAGAEGNDAPSAGMLASLAGLLGLAALARVRRTARG